MRAPRLLRHRAERRRRRGRPDPGARDRSRVRHGGVGLRALRRPLGHRACSCPRARAGPRLRLPRHARPPHRGARVGQQRTRQRRAAEARRRPRGHPPAVVRQRRAAHRPDPLGASSPNDWLAAPRRARCDFDAPGASRRPEAAPARTRPAGPSLVATGPAGAPGRRRDAARTRPERCRDAGGAVRRPGSRHATSRRRRPRAAISSGSSSWAQKQRRVRHDPLLRRRAGGRDGGGRHPPAPRTGAAVPHRGVGVRRRPPVPGARASSNAARGPCSTSPSRRWASTASKPGPWRPTPAPTPCCGGSVPPRKAISAARSSWAASTTTTCCGPCSIRGLAERDGRDRLPGRLTAIMAPPHEHRLRALCGSRSTHTPAGPPSNSSAATMPRRTTLRRPVRHVRTGRGAARSPRRPPGRPLRHPGRQRRALVRGLPRRPAARRRRRPARHGLPPVPGPDRASRTAAPPSSSTSAKYLATATRGRRRPERSARVVVLVAGTAPGTESLDDGSQPRRRLSPPCRRRPDDTAVILYTSGTTSDPKGVVLTHGNLLPSAPPRSRSCRSPTTDALLGVLPLFHALAQVANLLLPLTVGARIVFLETVEQHRDDARVRGAAASPRSASCRSSTTCSTSASWNASRRRPWPVAGRVPDAAARSTAAAADGSRVNLGRAVLRPASTRPSGGRMRILVTRRFPVRSDGRPRPVRHGLQHHAGLRPDRVLRAPPRPRAPATPTSTSVGQPLDGVEIRIAPDPATARDREHPDGEVLIRGPIVMAGYHNRPDANAVTLADGWLHTGDLGYLDADGRLVHHRPQEGDHRPGVGQEHLPEEIEAHLRRSRRSSRKSACWASRWPDEPAAERLHAIVVPEPRRDARAARRQLPGDHPVRHREACRCDCRITSAC